MSLLDLLFPKSCLECGKAGQYICQNCVSKVKTPQTICPVCLRFSLHGTHRLCRNTLGLDGLTCLWKYEGVIRKAILRLKYNFALEISKEISDFAVQKLLTSRSAFFKNGILVPVPLFWYRKNWRGFNQTEEIGRRIAAGLGLEFEPNLLTRGRAKAPQTELSRKDRLNNIKGVFSMASEPIFSSNYKIILFDDVWTTGSTLSEAALVLKQGGAKSVWGLTLAR